MSAETPIVAEIAALSGPIADLCRAAVASRPRALVTDVDGTLAPIAPTPEDAHLLPQAPALLLRAQQRFDVVAAVSGRDLASLWSIVRLPGMLYVGDHGNSWWQAPHDAAVPPEPGMHPAIAAALERLSAAPVTAIPGLRIEPKGATAAIHVRNVADPVAASKAVLDALIPIAVITGVTVSEGRAVIEIRAPGAQTKGDTLRRIVAQHRLRGAIYLGDDRTDLDAFDAAHDLRETGICQAVAVAVGSDEAPPDLVRRADLALATIDLVPAFLGWLLDASS
jgi:trehalose 6-phosphate phosphatase